MCGRFVLLTDLSRVTESFSIQDVACVYRTSNNTYPGQQIVAVVQPWVIHLKSGQPFGFAGLHETWVSPEGQPVHSYTIITITPNDLIEPIHNRMPVIVPKDLESAWLDSGHKDKTELLSILKPYPPGEMECLDQYPAPFYQ